MEPEDAPRWVLMTEQTYYVLMPLFAPYRQSSPAEPAASVRPPPSTENPSATARDSPPRASPADSGVIRLDYGRRSVVVAPMWDWTDAAELRRWAAALPDVVPELGGMPDRILVLAGGWGSPVIPAVPSLGRGGIVLEQTPVVTRPETGRRAIRMVAMIVDPRAAAGSASR